MLQVQETSCTSTAACTFSIPSPPRYLNSENLDLAMLFILKSEILIGLKHGCMFLDHHMQIGTGCENASMQMDSLGGAINAIALDATAFPHRNSTLAYHFLSYYVEPCDQSKMIFKYPQSIPSTITGNHKKE